MEDFKIMYRVECTRDFWNFKTIEAAKEVAVNMDKQKPGKVQLFQLFARKSPGGEYKVYRTEPLDFKRKKG